MGLPLLAGIIPSLLISQSFSDVGLSTHLRKVCRQKLFAEQSAELRARLSDSGATGRLCIRSSPVAGLPARAQQADSSANKTLATSEDQCDHTLAELDCSDRGSSTCGKDIGMEPPVPEVA